MVNQDGLVFKRRRRAPKKPAAAAAVAAPRPRREELSAFLRACRRFCDEEVLRAEGKFAGADDLVAGATRQVMALLFSNLRKLERGEWTAKGESQRKASLRALSQKLDLQEQQWENLRAKCRSLHDERAIEARQAELARIEEQASQEVGAEGPAQKGKLRDAFKDVSNKVEMQVEAMCGLVECIETLVKRADDVSGELQKDYHKQMFKHFAHVNSPKTLVKSLAKVSAAQ